MAKPIETQIVKRRGLNFEASLYPNQNGNYSPIVLEIEQLRERGLWANDPLITTQKKSTKKLYQDFFNHFYKMPLLKNFRLFEKRLYRWGWVGLVVRFYGTDKTKYKLGFETRKIQSVDVDIDTGEINNICTIWYFTTDGNEYAVFEVWDKWKVTRTLLSVETSQNIDIQQWNRTHPRRPIQDWNHNYGIIPILPVENSLGENGQVINGFNNALTHIDELDRLNEEIKYETIATRSKTYYDKKAFTTVRINPDTKRLEETTISESDILNQSIIGIELPNTSQAGPSRADNLNDKIKGSVPVILAQWDRSTLAPLLEQKEKKTTEIYSMLGFTNPNTTSQVPKTATEMEYYNENTASTLKNMSLERTNTLRDFIELIIQIGVSEHYSGFDEKMNIDDLSVKVIPNLKTNENLYFDYYKKKYDAKIISFQEFKEIIDNSDKETIDKWLGENKFLIASDHDIDSINTLAQARLLDKETLLKILFKDTLTDKEIQAIMNQAQAELPVDPTSMFDIPDDDAPLKTREKEEPIHED